MWVALPLRCAGGALHSCRSARTEACLAARLRGPVLAPLLSWWGGCRRSHRRACRSARRAPQRRAPGSAADSTLARAPRVKLGARERCSAPVDSRNGFKPSGEFAADVARLPGGRLPGSIQTRQIAEGTLCTTAQASAPGVHKSYGDACAPIRLVPVRGRPLLAACLTVRGLSRRNGALSAPWHVLGCDCGHACLCAGRRSRETAPGATLVPRHSATDHNPCSGSRTPSSYSRQRALLGRLHGRWLLRSVLLPACGRPLLLLHRRCLAAALAAALAALLPAARRLELIHLPGRSEREPGSAVRRQPRSAACADAQRRALARAAPSARPGGLGTNRRHGQQLPLRRRRRPLLAPGA